MRESGRAVQIANTIVETAKQCNLDRDIELPEEDAADLDMDARDSIVGNCYSKLMEIESRLLPCGLHIVGCPPTAEEAVATLVNIAEIDRPDNETPIKGLPSILAESIGRDMEAIYNGNNTGAQGLLGAHMSLQTAAQLLRYCANCTAAPCRQLLPACDICA